MSKKKTKKKQKHNLRIMVSSNAPWSTSGYGQQVKQFLPRIAKEGYPTACISFYGLEGGRLKKDGITYYPKMKSPWGDDAMVNHQVHFKSDVMITLQDIWTLPLDNLSRVNRYIPIVPIDHEPTPIAILERLKLAYRIITYSKFGHRQLLSEGYHSTYIPHTVDTKIFKPRNKDKAREEVGIPKDIYLFGMVAANKENPPRKSFQHVMDAFARFHKKHPKSGIYFHTLVDQQGGFNIKEYARTLGIQNAVYHLQPYELFFLVETKDMPTVYSSFDCLLSPSLNEGFGVPIIEAMACGVPAIVNNFTAMRDLVIDGYNGYKTKLLYKRYDNLQSYVGVPDTNSIYKCMETVYKDDAKQLKSNCVEHIHKEYDLNVVWNKHWKPFLQQLENEIKLTK